MHIQDLTAFEEATASIKVLPLAGHRALNKNVKSLLILDSSFNPPHSAHLALIRNALRVLPAEQPVSLVLMYAMKNADKEVDDHRETSRRIKLMQAFARTTSGLCETHLCLTKHPYFVDKFNAVRKDYPDAKQSYIVGYDTLVRILAKKYYPDHNLAKSGLSEFFGHGSLLCALRQTEQLDSVESQKDFMQNLADGTVPDVPAAWGKQIHVLELSEDEGLGVSSTRIRQAVDARDDVLLSRYLTPEVFELVKQNKMYTPEEMNIEFPYFSRQNMMNCSFSFWHSKFRHISPRARVIKPLPAAFIQYLNSDGLRLPQDSNIVEKFEDIESDSGSEFEDEGFSEEDPTDSFKDLHRQIEDEIRALGGAIVPKLNWSSPKDAVWISADKTMKCTSPSDVYLLLKSSDFIVHDLEKAFEVCDDSAAPMKTSEYELVLKKWFNAQPSMEFRCFVREFRLIGISQRDVNHYDFLAGQTTPLTMIAMKLFDEHLRAGFPDPNFVFDMYASIEQNKGWLLDINPYCATTDPLLFSWHEILSMPEDCAPEIRLVSKDSVMTQGPQYSTNRVPFDLIDSSDGVDPAEFAREFQQRLAKGVVDD